MTGDMAIVILMVVLAAIGTINVIVFLGRMAWRFIEWLD